MTDPTSQRPFDIIAIDGTMIDIVMKVPRLPGHGEKEAGEFVGRLPGGPCANFACVASRLGARVASLCTVGDDHDGQLLIDDFTNYGVATDFIQVRQGEQTAFTVILVEPSGERSIIAVPTFKIAYERDFIRSALQQTRAIHTFPSDAARFLEMAKIARETGTKVMMDVEASQGNRRATLDDMLRWVTVASFNERGFVTVTGETATVENARRLLAYGPEFVVVTLGPKGALAVSAETSVQLPGWVVDVKDTTGAGDTFNAAFLTSIARQKTLADSVAFANAAAALSVTGLGPRGHVPTAAEIETMLASRGGA